MRYISTFIAIHRYLLLLLYKREDCNLEKQNKSVPQFFIQVWTGRFEWASTYLFIWIHAFHYLLQAFLINSEFGPDHIHAPLLLFNSAAIWFFLILISFFCPCLWCVFVLLIVKSRALFESFLCPSPCLPPMPHVPATSLVVSYLL